MKTDNGIFYEVFNVIPGVQAEGAVSDLPTRAEMDAIAAQPNIVGMPLTVDHTKQAVGTVSSMFVLEDPITRQPKLMARMRFDMSVPAQRIGAKLVETGYYNAVSGEWYQDNKKFTGITLTDLPRVDNAYSVSSAVRPSAAPKAAVEADSNEGQNNVLSPAGAQPQLNTAAYKDGVHRPSVVASFAGMDSAVDSAEAASDISPGTSTSIQTNSMAAGTGESVQAMEVDVAAPDVAAATSDNAAAAAEPRASTFNTASEALLKQHPTGHGSVGAATVSPSDMVQVSKADWQMLNDLGHKQTERLQAFQTANTDAIGRYETLAGQAKKAMEESAVKDARLMELEAHYKVDQDRKAQEFAEVMQSFKTRVMAAAIKGLSPTDANEYKKTYERTQSDPMGNQAFARSVVVASFALKEQDNREKQALQDDINRIKADLQTRMPEPRYVNSGVSAMFEQRPVVKQQQQQPMQVQQQQQPMQVQQPASSGLQAQRQSVNQLSRDVAAASRATMDRWDPNDPRGSRVKIHASFATNGFHEVAPTPAAGVAGQWASHVAKDMGVPFYATQFLKTCRHAFAAHEKQKYGY